MNAPPKQQPESILELDQVALCMQGRLFRQRITASFHRGSLSLILGTAESGRQYLTNLVGGLQQPDRGRIVARGRVGPIIGRVAGLGATASVERDLGLCAAAFGIDTRQYLRSMASLLPDPGILLRPFDQIAGSERNLLIRAYAMLVPAEIYAAEANLVAPGETDPLANCFSRCRRDAAIIWLSDTPGAVNQVLADRYFLLSEGALQEFDTAVLLLQAFQAHGGTVHPAVLKNADRIHGHG